ncbi:MAG: hypothetical protein FWE28_05595 [Oscillospiraceae bacterium]|nr:hypothetical protein [Oscillospiraceae bacterium]
MRIADKKEIVVLGYLFVELLKRLVDWFEKTRLGKKFSSKVDKVERKFEKKYEKRFGRKKGDPIRVALKEMWIGITGVVVFGGLHVLLWVFTDETTTWRSHLIFGLLVLVGIVLIFGSVSEKIFMKDDHLIYRTLWRKTHRIPDRSLRGFKRMNKKFSILTNEKEYKVISDMMEGIDELQELCLSHIEKNKRYHETYVNIVVEPGVE